MDLYIDNEHIEEEVYQIGTLEDVLRTVQERLCAPGHVVISIQCDGEVVPSNTMTQTLKRDMQSFDRLDVFTGTKESLVLDAMVEAEGCLDATQAQAAEVSNLLTAGKSAEAVKMLGDCLRTWQQIHGSIAQSLQIMELSADSMSIRNQPLATVLNRPREVLTQIKEALMAQDYVLLADILQYEFTEVTALWHDIVAKTEQEARDRLLNM